MRTAIGRSATIAILKAAVPGQTGGAEDQCADPESVVPAFFRSGRRGFEARQNAPLARRAVATGESARGVDLDDDR
ncbi:MAG: hypothetical protein PHY16_17415 [Methylobacter sp.]|nr:hypothetical protein [Methylobacter sp.]